MEDGSVTCLDCGRDARDAEGYSWPYPEREGLVMCDGCHGRYWEERAVGVLAGFVGREGFAPVWAMLNAGLRPVTDFVEGLEPCAMCPEDLGVLYWEGDPAYLPMCPPCAVRAMEADREERAA